MPLRAVRLLAVIALCAVAFAGAARPGLQTRNSRHETVQRRGNAALWQPVQRSAAAGTRRDSRERPAPTTTTEAPVTTTTTEPVAMETPSAPAMSTRDGYTDAELMLVASCEQPGSGPGGVFWEHRGPVYEGGPGFWYGTWDAVREPEWPDNAGDASIPEQLEAMRRVLIRWPSAWGTCRSRTGVR